MPRPLHKFEEGAFVLSTLGPTFFFEDRCERDPNAWTKTTALFASWKDWSEKAGLRFGTITEFGEVLTKAGFTWRHTKKGNGYDGLQARQDQSPPFWGEAG